MHPGPTRPGGADLTEEAGAARVLEVAIDAFGGVDILALINSRLVNASLEGTDHKIRLLSHRAFGVHTAEPLIATTCLTI